MKKRGFTLVELLAVIAILAILVIIALPNVMGMFNSAKKNTFLTEVKKIYRGAEQAYVQDAFNNSGARTYSKCSSGCDKGLDMSIRDDLEYYIEINSQGKVVRFYARDNSYQFRYDGEMSINDIEDAQDISTLSDDEIVAIPFDNRNEVTIRYYNIINTDRANVCNDFTYDVACYEGQTIEECLGSHFSPGVWNVTMFTETRTPRLYGYSSQPYTVVNIDQPINISENVSYASIGCQCLDGSTEIEVYDKKKKKKYRKKLKDITYDDLILAWDFDKGEYCYVEPLWIMKPKNALRTIVLTFDDGTILRVVGDHRIFDYKKGTFVSSLKVKVGITTINSKGETIKLVDKKIIGGHNTAYNVITKNHINMFANGILTSQGSNNIYDIKDMKFVKVKREQFSESELKDVPKEYLDGLRLKEWIVDDKGSKEETLKDLYEYVDKLKNDKLI